MDIGCWSSGRRGGWDGESRRDSTQKAAVWSSPPADWRSSSSSATRPKDGRTPACDVTDPGVVIGSASGNEFFDHADIPDPDQMRRFAQEWATRGYLAPEQLAPSDHADAIAYLLTSRAQTDIIWMRHRTQVSLDSRRPEP